MFANASGAAGSWHARPFTEPQPELRLAFPPDQSQLPRSTFQCHPYPVPGAELGAGQTAEDTRAWTQVL